MTKASIQREPALPGETTSPVAERSAVARRRRVFLLTLMAVVVAFAIAANHGPVRSYLEARSRLDKVAAKVAALEREKAELQARLGKLTEAGYLETLAREELTYARAGEEVYIVTGVPADLAAAAPGTTSGEQAGSKTEDVEEAGTTSDGGESEGVVGGGDPADGPGPLERFLTRLLDLF